MVLTALLAGAALLAACGGSSGGAASPSAAASAGAALPSASTSAGTAPTPVPSPLVTSGPPPAAAVATVKEFWRTVGAGRMQEAQSLFCAPGSPILQWSGKDIAGARFVRVVDGSTSAGPPSGATVEFESLVWVKPSSSVSPWGAPGVHPLFESVVRMSDGNWRMWDSGTGP